MNGSKLKIATFHYPPFMILNETENDKWTLNGGIDTLVIKLLQQRFNFSYEIIVPKEREWGRIFNGSWTGVCGMAHRNEVDFGIANLMLTESRYRELAFSTSYNSDSWVMVVHAPRVVENTQAVLQPFRTEVWCAIFATLLVSTYLLYWMQRKRAGFTETPLLTWKDALWNMVAISCQEAVKLSRLRGGGLVLSAVWIFGAFVLQMGYGGVLTGFMTFPTREPSIKSLDELAGAIRKRSFKLGFMYHSNVEAPLMANGRHGQLFRRTVEGDPWSRAVDNHRGFQRVLADRFAFFTTDFGSAYDMYRVDFTRLTRRRVLGDNYIGVAYSERFPYRKQFDALLRKVTENGLIAKWKSDIQTRRRLAVTFGGHGREHANEEGHEEQPEPDSSARPLTISNLQGAFLLLASGQSLALLALLSEVLYRRFSKGQKMSGQHVNAVEHRPRKRRKVDQSELFGNSFHCTPNRKKKNIKILYSIMS